MAHEERLLTVTDVADRLRLGRSTIWALIARGDMPSLTIGRARRISVTQLNKWIRARITELPNEIELAASEYQSETAAEAGHHAAAHSGQV